MKSRNLEQRVYPYYDRLGNIRGYVNTGPRSTSTIKLERNNMSSMFIPAERETALEEAAASIGVALPEGAAATVAGYLNSMLPNDTTPATLVDDISKLFSLVIVNVMSEGFRLDVIETDETTLG